MTRKLGAFALVSACAGALLATLPECGGLSASTADASAVDSALRDGPDGSDGEASTDGPLDGGSGEAEKSAEAQACTIASPACQGCIAAACSAPLSDCEHDDSGQTCGGDYETFIMCACGAQNGTLPGQLGSCELEFADTNRGSALLACIRSSCAASCQVTEQSD